MAQEDKELLIKDLCARLPYGVKCYNRETETIFILSDVSDTDSDLPTFDYGFADIDDIKPYLRPMSSMTEEEKHDLLVTTVGIECVKYFQVLSDGSIDNTDAAHQDLYNFTMHWINFDGINTTSYLDWLNAHHFDYRGLIKKGLAIDCTNLNIY